MRQVFALTLLVTLVALPLLAGSPHFVGQISVERIGDDLLVSGKEAGLGNETQVHIVVTADALCINGGGNHPRAANKETFAAEEDVPVQNGKALFELLVEAAFQPECSPPMTVVWTNVVVSDTDHNVTKVIRGTF